jgi:hypothetical protein
MTYHTIYKKGFVASFETYPNGRTSYIITREGEGTILDWAQEVVTKERAIASALARIDNHVAWHADGSSHPSSGSAMPSVGVASPATSRPLRCTTLSRRCCTTS